MEHVYIYVITMSVPAERSPRGGATPHVGTVPTRVGAVPTPSHHGCIMQHRIIVQQHCDIVVSNCMHRTTHRIADMDDAEAAHDGGCSIDDAYLERSN